MSGTMSASAREVLKKTLTARGRKMKLVTNASRQSNGALMVGFLVLAALLRGFDPTLFALALFGAGQCLGFAHGRGWA